MRNNEGKSVHRTYYKRGISLVVLIITIIVALILISTVTLTTKKAIDNANLTTFAKDLTEIQEAAEGYYITNNIMPTRSDSTVMTGAEVIALSSDATSITAEINQNDDMDSEFFVVDLAKINVTKSIYGNKQGGDNSDVFVVAFPSMNAYYPYGVEINDSVYFSLTEEISSLTKISQTDIDPSLTTVLSSEGIKVTKNSGWANKMGVKIDATMLSGETLYMSVSGGTNRLITTVTGTNSFGFDLLSKVIAGTETLKAPTLTTTEANYIEAGTKPVAERYVDILKYKQSELIGKVRIDLSNFSVNKPTISTVTVSSYSTINTSRLVLSNSDSGIKEVRYEYLTKYTDNGTIENYYNGISDFDEAYMQSKARTAKITSDLVTTISTPKNVESVKVAVFDKAGNSTIYTKKVAPTVYIGYTLDTRSETSIQLTAKAYSSNGIKSITFSKSVDGVNFTNAQPYTLDTTTAGVTSKQSTPFTDIISNVVYIKMVAVNYSNTVTETRIVRINMRPTGIALGINAIATVNSTINGEGASYDNPIIPVGFKAVNDGTTWPTDWNKGLVIQDASGNQFVWVPVDGVTIPYEKWCTSGVSYTAVTNDTLPSGVTNEIDQIANYGGFYVARYEAGNASNILVSKKSSTIWGNINYTDSKTKAQAMYTTTYVKSGIITSTQWDTITKWIEKSGKNVLDSKDWGNHLNSAAPANVAGYGALQVTGFSEFWKANNIYDFAGNTWEWSSELNATNSIYRGGDNCNNTTSNATAATRVSTPSTNVSPHITFRVVLYVL